MQNLAPLLLLGCLAGGFNNNCCNSCRGGNTCGNCWGNGCGKNWASDCCGPYGICNCCRTICGSLGCCGIPCFCPRPCYLRPHRCWWDCLY